MLLQSESSSLIYFRAAQNKKIELSDLKAGAQSRPGSSNKRELHGWAARRLRLLWRGFPYSWFRYDGPLQYLAQTGNPDSAMTTVQVGVIQKLEHPQNMFSTEKPVNFAIEILWRGREALMKIEKHFNNYVELFYYSRSKGLWMNLQIYVHSALSFTVWF